MARNPEETRTKIMNAAEALILDHGFGGTTVEAVIARAGVTKGAFFHHFASKADLGHALVERYAALDAEHLERTLERAERLSRDPLQQVLLFVGLFEEELEALTEPYPGCLFASYCYQARLFDAQTMAVVRQAMQRWRERVGAKLREVANRHPPRAATDLDSLADMLLTIFEGAFVLSRTMEEPKLIARQLAHFRAYLELIFGTD
jgi:TetR/AcrR family transcriptional repressor of nem operon